MTLGLTGQALSPMRFEGKLTSWNDDRGFGRIESSQGGEPIFVHISAWPRGTGRPRLDQPVTFEVELGPKGKRAKNVQLLPFRSTARVVESTSPAQWGTTTLFAIPAFVLVYFVATILWRVPLWVGALYLALSVTTFAVYSGDKAAAASATWRTPEATMHALSVAGGWPGALLAQQVLRHKSTKHAFRRRFWVTVVVNVAGFILLASPLRQSFLVAM